MAVLAAAADAAYVVASAPVTGGAARCGAPGCRIVGSMPTSSRSANPATTAGVSQAAAAPPDLLPLQSREDPSKKRKVQ